MRLKFTILGCGSSAGVPRIGGDWGACDPENPKNRRRRCSLLIERKGQEGSTNVLIDTSPDIREQLLSTDTSRVDGVLFTHDHADHTHGIDDLRVLALTAQKRVDVYMDQQTVKVIQTRFGYCFETPPGSSYPPILNANDITPGVPLHIEGGGGIITALPYLQHHGEIDSLGFRFGNLAYSSDVHDLPRASLEHLQDLDIWIVDALRYRSHPSHFNVDQALTWIERIKPKRAILTNMHVDLDYDTLVRELPDHVEPAYDGMVLEQTVQ